MSGRRWAMLSALVFLLLWLRRPDALTNPQFWAEDAIFYVDPLIHSGAAVLFRPYNGYLHLAPRLIAEISLAFPPAWAPAVTNLCALVMASLTLSLFALARYRHLLASNALRIAVSLIMATAFQSDELIANIACVHCYLLIGILLALLQPAEAYTGRYRWSAWMAIPAVAIAGLSDASVVLFVPIAMVIAFRRSGGLRLVSLTVIATAVVQLAVLRAHPQPMVPVSPGNLVTGSISAALYRVVLVSLAGLENAQGLAKGNFAAVLVVMLTLIVLWLTSLWWQMKPPGRWRILACVYLTLGSIVLAMAGRSMTRDFLFPGIAVWRAERYFFLGACLFTYLAAVSLERWMPPIRAQAGILAVIFAGGIWANFRAIPFVDYHWREQAYQVERWRNQQRSRQSPAAVSITVNPGGTWRVLLPGK